VGLSLSIFWDFYKNDKTEFEKVCLLGFLAIKSILGNAKYCNTNNDLLFARMIGENKATEFLNLPEEILKYRTRHYLNKRKNYLQVYFHLNYWSFEQRGFYVSFDLDELQLSEISEPQKYKNQVKRLEEKRKDIINKINQNRPPKI